MKRRVVVTGMAGLCPLGMDWPSVRVSLQTGRSGIRAMPEWAKLQGLKTRLAGTVPDFARPAHYHRKKTRSMGRTAMLAVRASELALGNAGLALEQIAGPRTGIAYGSTSGSPPALAHFVHQVSVHHNLEGITGAEFIQSMSHTCAINLAQFFGVEGRIIPACSACTCGSQAIGFACESIRHGYQDVMIAGGAEEMHVSGAAVFDLLLATSTRNDTPTQTPRPFDRTRDGLVVGEGAATLILESFDHARARRAPILAELIGFATNCDGRHVVNPSAEGMEQVMRLALADAEIDAAAVDYVNAHATATEVGDIAESLATRKCFDRLLPISSLKGFMGHTLGACGALEAWICIHAMREGWMPANLNLHEVDPRCAKLDYLREIRELNPRHIMTNNFAFGGINTSLIFRRAENF